MTKTLCIMNQSPSYLTLSLKLVFFLILTPYLSFATIYECSSVEEIRTAMSVVIAGDEIVIASGTYQADNVAASGTGAHFVGNADGTAEAPIIIRSASVDNPAILSGDNLSSLTVLRIFGDHWIVRDLNITYAQKGLVFDHANYGQAINCEIYDIGYEAIHIRDGSDYVLIENCNIHHTGQTSPGFGEGIYIGSDKGAWDNYDPYVDYTTVRYCTIGPEVKAEAFDIKEGTRETIVEYNIIDATGISGSNYADSFVDLKGTRTYIRHNTFYRNGAVNLEKGIAGIDRGVELSCYQHVVHDNVFYMDTPDSGNMVEAYNDVTELHACNNTRIPEGMDYGNNVELNCLVEWYNPGGDACNIPYGLAIAEIGETSATLNWGGDPNADTYELRFQPQGGSTWTTISNIISNTYMLTELEANTNYSWEVATVCEGEMTDFTAGPGFTTNNTGSGGGGNGLIIYDDALMECWNNYSFSGTYDLANANPVQVGSHSFRADYNSWGGVLLSCDGVELTNETAIRFWVRGEGDYLLRMEINNVEYEFTTTSNWQQMTLDLSTFNNPTTITELRFQNRSAENRTVFFDQIELINNAALSISDLQDFKVQVIDEQAVALSWKMQNGFDNGVFEIERRSPIEGWKKIGLVENISSSTTASYTFLDENIQAKEYFYRLKLLYPEGRFQYSDVESIVLSFSTDDISVWPNPFSEAVQIQLNNTINQFVTVNIFNANGQQVKTIEKKTTEHVLVLTGNDLPKGLYFLHITINEETFIRKLVKK